MTSETKIVRSPAMNEEQWAKLIAEIKASDLSPESPKRDQPASQCDDE